MYWNATCFDEATGTLGLTLTWDVLKSIGVKLPKKDAARLTLTWDVLKSNL